MRAAFLLLASLPLFLCLEQFSPIILWRGGNGEPHETTSSFAAEDLNAIFMRDIPAPLSSKHAPFFDEFSPKKMYLFLESTLSTLDLIRVGRESHAVDLKTLAQRGPSLLISQAHAEADTKALSLLKQADDTLGEAHRTLLACTHAGSALCQAAQEQLHLPAMTLAELTEAEEVVEAEYVTVVICLGESSAALSARLDTHAYLMRKVIEKQTSGSWAAVYTPNRFGISDNTTVKVETPRRITPGVVQGIGFMLFFTIIVLLVSWMACSIKTPERFEEKQS
eukprot:gnl/Trimastix_PCT/1198.p2 GENE.gnl/Trimastix_PCT/1198~~gnl/Trimastix_PCT/1198.p2  ORF type:complete len:289 (-),score=64.72 gnl/Trimastix_PCT/1198:26-865(-)